MNGNFSWQGLSLHLENLIPGILLTVEINILGFCFRNSFNIPKDGLISGLLFVAGSYALGLISAVISRAIVDCVSEKFGVRAVVFKVFSHQKRDDLKNEFQNDTKFQSEIKRDKSNENLNWLRKLRFCVRDWNAIYRAALRKTSRIEEVDRRRVQGRIVRNLFFPIILAACIIAGNYGISHTFAFLGAVIIGLFLYAYSELINFAEARDIAISQDSTNKTSS